MAQQAATENAPNKPVHLIYLCGAVLPCSTCCSGAIDWIWGYFGAAADASSRLSLGVSACAATVVGVVMYRSDQYYGLANEVSSELKKVTWPTAKEVRSATMVVIVDGDHLGR